MTGEKHLDPKTQVLTPEDLEAALRMLADEERAAPASGKASLRDFVSALIDNLIVGFLFSAFFSAIIVVWFRPWRGLQLLGAGLVVVVLLGIKVVIAGTELTFKPPKGSALAETAQKAWAEKFRTEGCLVFPGCLIWIAALGWMLFGLITQRDIFPGVLIPLAIGTLILAFANAVGNYRTFKYFSSVARLKDRLQSLPNVGVEQTPNEANVSEKDRALLAKVEIRQVARAAAKDWEEFRQQSNSYSVAIEQGPRDYLGGLDEKTRYNIRAVLDDLQAEPRPPDSRVADSTGAAGVQTINLEAGGHLITYLVDSARQRVDVIQISPIPLEVQHA